MMMVEGSQEHSRCTFTTFAKQVFMGCAEKGESRASMTAKLSSPVTQITGQSGLRHQIFIDGFPPQNSSLSQSEASLARATQ
jgi:hypothetical protein